MMNQILAFFLTFLIAFAPFQGLAAPKTTLRQFFAQPENLLPNPGAENATASWEVTGSGTLVLDTTTPLDDSASLVWDPSAAGEFLRLKVGALPIKEGQKGLLCEASAKVKWLTGTTGDIKIQLRDGTNTLQEVDIPVTTSQTPSKIVRALVSCPNMGNLEWRMESFADATAVTIDRGHLGSSLIEATVGTAELIASKKLTTTGCIFSTTATGLIEFTVPDTDCNVTPEGRSDTVQLPQIEILNAPPGRYKVTFSGALHCAPGNPNTECNANIFEDVSSVSIGAGIQQNASSSDSASHYASTTHGFYTQTMSGDVRFQVRTGLSAGTGTASIECDLGDQRSCIMTIERYPLDSEQAVLLSEANGWHIDANMGGANASLGTASVTTYTEITNASLDLVLNPGSATVEIACASGTASTGLTCSVDESVGIAFVIPYAGTYKVCSEFSHVGDHDTAGVNSDLNAIFQLAETSNTSSTILQEGHSKIGAGVHTGATNSDVDLVFSPVHVCGDFEFLSSGQKTIRLMYEQFALGISGSDLSIDRSGTNGQRDMRWSVQPISQNFPMPVILDTVVSPGSGARVRHYSAYIQSAAGTPSILHQTGDWLTSVTDNGVGLSTINILAGKFAVAYSCSCSTSGGGWSACQGTASGAPLLTAFSVQTYTGDPPVTTDARYEIICTGQ